MPIRRLQPSEDSDPKKSSNKSSSTTPKKVLPEISPEGTQNTKASNNTPRSDEYVNTLYELKNTLHQELIEAIDLDVLVRINQNEIRDQLDPILRDLIKKHSIPLTTSEKNQLIKEIIDETFGLGPLEPLINDVTIDEILVNHPKSVYIEKEGKLYRSSVTFKDNNHLMHVINRIVSRVGRHIDEATPMADARLPDGSRVNAIIPPLAIDGPYLSIRKFRKIALKASDLLDIGTVNDIMLNMLEIAVQCKLNIIVSGGTGSGKTTFLNVLSSFVSPKERIITIEDAAELQLQQPHVVRLETRPANAENRGLVTARDLLRNALRMRPDRIIVGEVRAEEALDMLQAMNTGHDGSLTTIHSNSPRDAISRIETMVLLAAANLNQRTINKQIVSAVDLIVQIRRYPDGVRRIESITELIGMEEAVITLNEIACFVSDVREENNEKKMGYFKAHATKPHFFERAKSLGVGTYQIQQLSKFFKENVRKLR